MIPGSSKPGASSDTIWGAKKYAASTSAASTTASSDISRLASWNAASLPPLRSARMYVGTKAEESAPSANRSRRRLGILKAAWKASA